MLAVIDDRATTRKIIDHIGIAAHPKPPPRAHGPGHYESPPEGTENLPDTRGPAERFCGRHGEGAL